MAKLDHINRQGQAFVLVYSVASKSSFKKLETYRNTIRLLKEEPAICLLVGNKRDMKQEREVSKKEGIDLANKLGCFAFFETSAKCAKNVARIFEKTVYCLRHATKAEDKRKKGAMCVVM